MATSGPNIAGTGADDNAVGTKAWTNPGNVTASDDTRASCADIQSATSHYLKATNFGFAIPAGATINGIQVEWERQQSTLTTDNSIKIVKGGTISGDEKSAGAAWTASDGFGRYGGPSDLWGLTWAPSDINSSTFGAVLSCSRSSADASVTAFVDACRVTVYYTEASVQTLTVNGTSGTEASGWQAEGGDHTRLQSDDGDTNRLYTPTNNDTYFVTLTDTSGLSGATIHSLTVYAKVRSLDPVSNTVQIGVKVSGTNYWSSDFDANPSTSYVLQSRTWTTNPATGLAWTASEIDGVEVGLKKTNAAGMGWTYSYAEVDYTPGGSFGKAFVARQAVHRSTTY